MIRSKELGRMNRFNMVLSGSMFLVSLYHAVSSALKYGITWEVQTVINGIVSTSTQNTFLNILMSGMFAFIMITSGLTLFFLGWIPEPKGEAQ